MAPNERAAMYIAPPLAPVVWTTVLVFPGFFQGMGMTGFWEAVAVVAIFGIPVAYVMALCFGLPLYIMARNHCWANFWSLSFGAAAIAMLPTLVTLLFMYDSWEAGRDWKVHGLFAFTGFVVGAAFWCIVRLWPHNRSFNGTPGDGR